MQFPTTTVTTASIKARLSTHARSPWWINAAKVAVTGNKFNDKMYHHHTGYVGNLKSVPFKDLISKKPEEVIQKAVKGMLPKGPLGREMARKMKVFAGSEHSHAAQQPQVLDI